MISAARTAPDLRVALRAPGGGLASCPVGTVPILWNNIDVEELRLGTPAATILDEVARTGYDGVQLGIGFPAGEALRDALAARGLRLAEVYAQLPATVDGPVPGAVPAALERLELLEGGDGDVLCLALDLSPGRIEAAGRATGAATPRMTDAGWTRLVDAVHELGDATRVRGRRAAFHPHAGTFIETPDEVDRLAAALDPGRVGICLDVGHYLVGGGDPVAAIHALGARVTHVHLKDVDPVVLGGLRDGSLAGFPDAIRARLFTELGAGILDLDAVLVALDDGGYDGWLMVEQDSAWGPPSESAAIGRRILATALRRVGTR